MGEQFTVGDAVDPPPGYGTWDNGPSRLMAWGRELAHSYTVMQNFIDMDPTEVFRHLSQFSARASEMRSQIGITEGRKEAQFRIKIIDPFIEECERQFKLHSRIQAIREMDARLAGGAFA